MGNAEERHGGVSLSPFPLQRRDSHRPSRTRVLRLITTSLVLFAVASFYYATSCYERASRGSAFDVAKQCTISNLHSNLSFLDPAVPIAAEEFLERRDRLARALVESKVDAFVLEPGYTFQYYGNISQTDWEPWEPEERPFLMLILPEISPAGKVRAKTAFLSPHFEEGRVRMLGIPSREAELDIVIWEEHWNPYDVLLRSRLFDGRPAKLMVDEEIRDFIVRGLDAAGFETVGLAAEVELVRQQKSAAEVELLRAVNTGTVAAVRSMRPCLLPGLTEVEVTRILDSALRSVGFGLFFNIVLFEEHGALPHGGFVTGWKKLTHDTMVVIDVGAHYMGYSSDICRSFLIDPPRPRGRSVVERMLRPFGRTGSSRQEAHPAAGPELRAEKFKVWQIVLDAQTAAAAAFRPNNTAASVDIAARAVIQDAGYGHGFTHRLGHGIGIKAHESPYLNKWNTATLLQPGMTFTNEPGIYLENRFGVRHEDIYLVKESGEAELLSGPRATGPYDP
ncbi:putative peptidase C18A7.01 [Colletotrichum tanaceti]|uniref:Putative peptidase C18A7.01 n=1 Tax=Colletotrichum tanaceti TaxID=1306861 RepID=A0A4U6XT66_9PEZI|nr:putative peptidase C18A7.01 [Colletotrichum tanaceti]TKW59082.1 putative peptidase C18A7.01 [Colletotrichum tanaceti]